MAITNESLEQATERIQVSFEVVNLKDIRKNPKNPRKISKDKLEHLQESIETIPEMLMADEIIVDENNMIISGHQRFEVLKRAGVEKVRVKKCVGYTEAQKEEIMVRKNVIEGEFDSILMEDNFNIDDLIKWGAFDVKKEISDEKEIEEKPPVIITSFITLEYNDEIELSINDDTATNLMAEMISYKDKHGSYDGFWDERLKNE